MVSKKSGQKTTSTTNERSLLFDEITSSDKYQALKTFRQHGTYSVYDHSINVYKTCFKIIKRYHLKLDEKSLAKAALLHDYFLYDWHDKDCPKHHFTRHPYRAVKNARRDFGLTKKEEKMMLSHMFPAGLKVPTSREAVILTLADKRCAISEFLHKKKNKKD